MNELNVFENPEFGKIRTLTIEGEPWFVEKDVAEYFGDTNYRRSLKRLDNDEKGFSRIPTSGGMQNMIIINESGLYSLILSSKMPNARKFKRWVTSEVLPAIRKTGHYGTMSSPFCHVEAISSSPIPPIRIHPMQRASK